MKKTISILLTVVLTIGLCFGTMGCSKKGENGELNLFVWTEYVPESVLEAFEEETGIKVNVSYYSSNEDLYSKLMSESEGTYDVIQPSDYMVEKLIKQDKLQKIDKSQLSNLGNISSEYMDQSYDPGNEYSIPYMCAMGGIAVNTSMISDNITSYADLFNSKYANQLLVLDDSRAVIGITAKSLGYSMSTTDENELAKIKEKLLTLKNNIKIYDSDSPKTALISGDCAIAFCYNAEIALAMEENPDIKYVYPEEGAYLNEDNWCITKGAKNTENALKFINFVLDGKNSASCSEELPYINPNKAACEILGDDYTSNPVKKPTEEQIEKCEFIQNLDSGILEKYEAMWTELKK